MREMRDEQWKEEKEEKGGEGEVKVITAASHDPLLGKLRFR